MLPVGLSNTTVAGAGAFVNAPVIGASPLGGISILSSTETIAAHLMYSPLANIRPHPLLAAPQPMGANGSGNSPSAPGGVGGGDDGDADDGGKKTPKVDIISPWEVTALLDNKFGKGFEYTEGAAERIGMSPGILFELLSAEAARFLKTGYTKIYLSTGELQVIFQRDEDWGNAEFYLPSEVQNLPADTPSYTVRYHCPHAREAFTIAKFFDAYHAKTAHPRSEAEFLANAVTEHGLYAPSPLLAAYKLFQQPEFANKSNFIDPACGPGGVVFMASLFFRKCTGGDLNERFYDETRKFDRSLTAVIPSEDNVSFHLKNYLDVDYTAYDVVYLFLDKSNVPELELKLASQLRPGSIVVCFGMPKFKGIPKVKNFMGFDIYRV